MPIRGDEIVTTFKGDTRNLDQAFRSAERRTQEHVGKVNSALGGIGRGSGGIGGGGVFGTINEALKLLPGIGTLATGISKVTGAISSGIGVGFGYNRMIQESSIGFEKLMGSAEGAERHIKALSELRKDGIGLEEALLGSKRLQAMGIRGTEVIATLRAVGDAARGSGADVDSVIRALTQMRAKGTASSEEISQQLAEQGIPAWRYLADAIAEVDKNFAKLGSEERLAKVRKLVEQGKISGKGASQAILGGLQREYGGTGARYANETVSGLEGQLGEDASRLAGIGSKPSFDKYQQTLGSAVKALNSEAALGAAESAAKVQESLFGAFDSAVEGVRGILPKAKEAGASVAGSIIGAIEERFEGHAPSKVMQDIGIGAGLSLVKGFQSVTQQLDGIQDKRRPYDPQRITDLVGVSQDPDNDYRGAARRNKPSRRSTNPLRGGGSSLIDALRESIIGQESNGKTGIVNPHSGALGLGQVMPYNVAPWTKAALGEALSAKQFLASKEAQLKTINFKLNEYLQQEMARSGGNEDTAIRRVAALWYSGNADLYNSTKKQFTKGREYPSISEYTSQVLARVRSQTAGFAGSPDVLGGPSGALTPGRSATSMMGGYSGIFSPRQSGMDTIGGRSGIFNGSSLSNVSGQFEDIRSEAELLEEPLINLTSVLIPRATDGTLEWGKSMVDAGRQGQTAIGQVALTYEDLYGKQRTLKQQFEDLAATIPSFQKEVEGIMLGLPEGIGASFGNAFRNADGTIKGFLIGIRQGVAETLQDIAAQMLQSQVTRLLTSLLGSVLGGFGGGASAGSAGFGGGLSFGFAGGHAAGGLIGGVGTGTSDSNLAFLSRGEFVMSAAAVQQIGAGNLAAMNADRASQSGGNHTYITQNIMLPASSNGGNSFDRRSQRELADGIMGQLRRSMA
jgi:tape measure domain-containing protein